MDRPRLTGKHFDEGKPRVDLLDPDALEGIARVLTYGVGKYGDHNWRGGIKFSRILGSLLRHLFAIIRREDIDPESGLPHVDHLSCNAMFLSYYMKNRKDCDDRWDSATTRDTEYGSAAKSGKDLDARAYDGEGKGDADSWASGKDVDRSLSPPGERERGKNRQVGSISPSAPVVDSSISRIEEESRATSESQRRTESRKQYPGFVCTQAKSRWESNRGTNSG